MPIPLGIVVGAHLLKAGGKKFLSKMTKKAYQLSNNEKKALEIMGKGPKIGKDKLKIKKKDKKKDKASK